MDYPFKRKDASSDCKIMKLVNNNLHDDGYWVECRCTEYAEELLDDNDIKELVEIHLPIALKRINGNSGLYQFTYDEQAISGIVFIYRGTVDKITFCFGSEEEATSQWDVWLDVFAEFGVAVPC